MHAGEFPIQRLCQVLGVSTSGYYGWRQRRPSGREMANQQLVEQIQRLHQESDRTYGSPRIHRALAAQGYVCNHKRVERLMRLHGIVGEGKRRRRICTTDSQHGLPVAANLLDQDFTVEAPNRKWTTDITYSATDEGWLYLAVVLDLFSRKVVGWAMDASLATDLVLSALNMALQTRKPMPGLLHHSDRGSQYASHDYQARLTQARIQVSMSRTGNGYDNAVMESFFATLKSERVYRRHYATRAQARADLFLYIEGFYNQRRLHSALDYLSPCDFEKVHNTVGS